MLRYCPSEKKKKTIFVQNLYMKGYRGFIQITKYWKQPKGPLTGKLINRQCDLQAMDCYSRGRTSEPKNLKRMMPRSQTEKVMYCINLLQ